MRRRGTIITIIAIVSMAVAGDVAYWRIAADRLRSGYEDWRAARIAEGWNVGSGSLSIGGWPRAATVAVPNLILRHAGPAVPGDIEISSPAITLSVSLLRPDMLMILPAGPTHLRFARLPEVILAGADDWLAVPLQPGGSRSFDLHAAALRVQPSNAAWHATAGFLNAHATIPEQAEADQAGGEPTQPAVTFTVNAEAIVLPAVVKWPLGTNISSLSLDGLLNGPFPATRDVTRWAANWRDGGGSLAITHLAMGWGPLGLTSSATLALDEQLQPMGSGNGRIVGYAETLDRLAAGGMLTKSAATAAKAVLSLMAESTGADEPSVVDVPLTLQFRTLSMRQVPLIRLQELDWPAR